MDSAAYVCNAAACRSFGDLPFKTPRLLVEASPEVSAQQLTPDHSFAVLASDGLWDVMSDVDAVDVVQRALQVRLAWA